MSQTDPAASAASDIDERPSGWPPPIKPSVSDDARAAAQAQVPTLPSAGGVNPKDAIGSKKAGLRAVSGAVLLEMGFDGISGATLFEMGLGMTEGEYKYGRHNFRSAPVRASVYYDAGMRHLFSWQSGEDIDPDSGLHHLTKLLSCMHVIRDAQIQGSWYDDRPVRSRYVHVRDLRAGFFENAMYHLISWWEGQDIDPNTGKHHLTQLLIRTAQLRTEQIDREWYDDRPPVAFTRDWMAPLNEAAKALCEKYPKPVAPYLELTHGESAKQTG